jgi:hypothetical protein
MYATSGVENVRSAKQAERINSGDVMVFEFCSFSVFNIGPHCHELVRSLEDRCCYYTIIVGYCVTTYTAGVYSAARGACFPGIAKDDN